MTGHPDAAIAKSPDERATLSRELSDFLIEFSIALHKHAMYPEGHPSLLPAAGGVGRRLEKLFVDRATLSLGVAKNQLVIEGVATDAKNPVLSDLASRLHRHHLGAVTFKQGAAADEIHHLLGALAVEADRSGEPLGLGDAESLVRWPHARLYPLTYERLDLVDSDEEHPEDVEERRSRTRSAQLWVGLARAALAAEEAGDELEQEEMAPHVVAEAIGTRAGESAYDQVIVGYLLQIADELRAAGGREAIELKNRMAQLIGALDKNTLNRLLQMGGDGMQRREFLLTANQGMDPEAVLELVRAAADDERGQTVSHSMLRMLQKLQRHARGTSVRRRIEAEGAMRDQISELVRGWALRDPNPDAYRKALESMSEHGPLFAVAPDQRFRAEPKRVVEMALEVDTMGEPVTRAVDELLEAGEARWLVERLEDAQAPKVTQALLRDGSDVTVRMVARVAGASKIDVQGLDALLGKVGLVGAAPMLDVLCASESSQARRTLLDRLVGLGPAVGPMAVARLDDPRWYVQRNMLTILGDLPALPEGFDAAAFSKHDDARVRREAFRILLREPATRDRHLGRALADSDPRILQQALTVAAEGLPDAAVSLVVSKATATDLPDEVRTLAVRVLARAADPNALDALLILVKRRRSLIGTRRPPKSPVYLAALAALRNYGDDPRAQAALEDAIATRDPEVVRAAQGDDPEHAT